MHKVNGSQSLTQLSSQEELYSTSTAFFSSPSAWFSQVTTRVGSMSQGAGGEEWVECAMEHCVWSCIMQMWAMCCLVFDPCARLWSDFLALVVKHTVQLQGCCLEPMSKFEKLGLVAKAECGLLLVLGFELLTDH